jgi:hypothetical protein
MKSDVDSTEKSMAIIDYINLSSLHILYTYCPLNLTIPGRDEYGC